MVRSKLPHFQQVFLLEESALEDHDIVGVVLVLFFGLSVASGTCVGTSRVTTVNGF